MYKVKNVYKECHILDLNLMDAVHYKRSNFTGAELCTLVIALIIFLLVLGATALPEMAFFAECQNIPGGDICHISLK